MATTMTTAQLRKLYAKYAGECVAAVNDIRRMAGRSDRYSMRQFNADTREDILKASGTQCPTPQQWVQAARRRMRDLGR